MAGRAVVCLFFVVIFMIKVTLQSLQDDIELRMNDTGKTLSRKRRYLIFPEGSSLQLVYCLTIPSIGVGSIFTIGSTAALAWQLPHDPLMPFRRPSEVLHRIDEKPTINRGSGHASGGWTLHGSGGNSPVSSMKTYYNPFLINKPPVAGYSTINAHTMRGSLALNQPYTRRKSDYRTSAKSGSGYYGNNRYQTGVQYGQTPIYDGAQYAPQRTYSQQPVTSYVHPVYHKIYRRTRRDLYSKIEKLFTALSRDGKACLLKAVCEVSKATRERGTFMEEIIKAIFRVRHHTDESEEERDVYDSAANNQHNCTDVYPSCEHSVWSSMFSFT